jgi:hypothetical protein
MTDSQQPTDPRIQAIRDMRHEIIEQELPAITRFLAGMQQITQNGNRRIQAALEKAMLETAGQGRIIEDGLQATFRLLHTVHVLLNSDLIIELIEGNTEGRCPVCGGKDDDNSVGGGSAR